MHTADQRKVVIIAGPNGAGKTTFAREFLPAEAALPVFINADLIAAGLSPFDPAVAAIRAGRLMLQEIDRHAMAGRSFAFETTLAGHTYLHRIDTWRADGFIVELIFLSLVSPEEAIARGDARSSRWSRRPSRCRSQALCHRYAKLSRGVPAASRFLAVVRQQRSASTTAGGRSPSLSEEHHHELKSKLQNADMQAAPAALLRAARRAREIARQTNTAIVVVREGVLVEERVEKQDDSSSGATESI